MACARCVAASGGTCKRCGGKRKERGGQRGEKKSSGKRQRRGAFRLLLRLDRTALHRSSSGFVLCEPDRHHGRASECVVPAGGRQIRAGSKPQTQTTRNQTQAKKNHEAKQRDGLC